MAAINFRQLIDLAIGSPEPGHVNFYALHCLLCSFAHKLNVIEDEVDCNKCGYEALMLGLAAKTASEPYMQRRLVEAPREIGNYRMTGGADSPVEGEPAGAAASPEGEAQPADVGEAEAPPTDAPPTEAAPTAAPSAEALPVEEAAAAPVEVEAAPPPAKEPEVVAAPVAAAPEPKFAQRSSAELMPVAKTRSVDSSVARGPFVLPADVQRGMAIMKDQLELTMEQLHKLTALLVRNRMDTQKIGQVRALAKQLRSIQRENVYIEGTNRFQLGDDNSLSGLDSEGLEEEDEGGRGEGDLDGHVELRSHTSLRTHDSPMKMMDAAANDQYNMDMHLCYSPEKMLDLMLELKSEFCMLSNKLNELSAVVLAQDSNRTSMLIQELQEQLRDLKLTYTATRGQLDMVESRLGQNVDLIDKVHATVVELAEDKLDKAEMTVLMADKVDYTQLQRKVSKEQMQELQCRIEKSICELQKTLGLNEANIMKTIDEMRQALGIHVVEEILRKFQEKVNADIRSVSELLKKYMDMTNDDCAAAGARIKVLQDLACLSCDTTCVMRSMERSKVAKLPSAKASNLLSPLITYELGTIRKSGIMGYYRKDEFPHAPNAWMDQQKLACQQARHAGGAHTTYTAKERVEKVLQQQK